MLTWENCGIQETQSSYAIQGVCPIAIRLIIRGTDTAFVERYKDAGTRSECFRCKFGRLRHTGYEQKLTEPDLYHMGRRRKRRTQ